jgi:L-lactate dehydrogenase complex protein LldG
MSPVASSRKQVLDRIRAAHLGGRNPVATAEQATEAHGRLPRDYAIRGKLTVRACQELFSERLREYDAEVVECLPEELAAAIAAQLRSSGRHIFVAPPRLPAAWIAAGFEWRIDHNLPPGEIEKAEGAVTACFCGVAESGTIVTHHSAAEGRRVITLLPEWHLCVVRASQIVETLPEYFDRCRQPPALVTWISGPSATADIEMTRIKGVHGPRFLQVILVRDE